MQRPFCLIFVLAVIILLSGCSSQPRHDPAIGEAYAGPLSLNIRQDLTARAPVSATVGHGERLEILQTRRRFTRVRTVTGVEGWVDGRQLLSPRQMEELRHMAGLSAKLPSQGRASVYEVLNVHTAPNRGAPSFAQIPEGGVVDVIGHQLAPRVAFQPPAAPTETRAIPAPRRKPKEKAARSAKTQFELNLPMPPEPPENWLQLSPAAQPPPRENPAVPESETPPVKVDDWSLVRLKDGKAGWVLTRMLIMSIPDEVAQYAEGHRITSYFSLGSVQDGGHAKHHWLWTTLSKTLQDYQFDSVRVFIYNARRHRYETAYIERNLKGYYPVSAHPVRITTAQKSYEAPGFSIVVTDKEGNLVRRTYGFEGYRVRMIRKEPYQKPAGLLAVPPPASDSPGAAERGTTGSWIDRTRRSLRDLFR